MLKDDIFPGKLPSEEAGEAISVSFEEVPEAQDTLRWAMAALLFQVLVILIFTISWIPNVEWVFSACCC